MKRKTWIISAYDQSGRQFGDTIEANNVDEMFRIFKERNPDCDIADYDESEPLTKEEILQILSDAINASDETGDFQTGTDLLDVITSLKILWDIED